MTTRAKRESLEDAEMLALETEEGAGSQGRKATFPGARKDKGKGFSLGASGRTD